ncbi:FAD:protein FMN transferase [Spongiimicrobium sp. 2-473A-2-J]|uniref:FAD:protein FMN transferase n=1 Tax=Eudoraea algarum TaxID=3417568 RepID=UPI003D3671FF
MGSSFELGIVASNEAGATPFLEQGVAEIQRIERLLTEFDSHSQTSLINVQAAKAPVSVDKEVMDLLQRSQAISKLTKGYFDISVGPLKKLYQFKNKAFRFPDRKHITEALKKVGYQNIVLDPQAQTVFLRQAGMHLSFAAIGKGYAADCVRKKWIGNQVAGGYINASGDLTTFGCDARGEAWKIGIASPDDRNHTLLQVPLKNASVATSGDYEQHFLYQGKRYSHNIDPMSGMPITGIKSVSVFSPSAELSDALATAIYAMGVKKGLSFLNQLPQTHGIIINDQNEIYFSNKLHYEAISSAHRGVAVV